MKKLLIITLIALGVMGCGGSNVDNINIESTITPRIKSVEYKVIGYHYLYIIKVDCTEYLILGDGGIIKLDTL